MSFKPIYSKDHAEIVAGVWEGLSDEEIQKIYLSVYQGLEEEAESQGGYRYTDVVRVSWALGFHYCMMLIEHKALVTTDLGQAENN